MEAQNTTLVPRYMQPTASRRNTEEATCSKHEKAYVSKGGLIRARSISPSQHNSSPSPSPVTPNTTMQSTQHDDYSILKEQTGNVDHSIRSNLLITVSENAEQDSANEAQESDSELDYHSANTSLSDSESETSTTASTTDLSLAEQRIAHLTHELETSQHALENQATTFRQLTSFFHEQEASTTHYMSIINEQKTQMRDLIDEIKLERSTNKQLEQQVSTLDSENSRLKAQALAALAQLTQETQVSANMKTQLGSEIHSLHVELVALEDANAQLKDVQKFLVRQNKELRTQVQSLRRSYGITDKYATQSLFAKPSVSVQRHGMGPSFVRPQARAWTQLARIRRRFVSRVFGRGYYG
jgi:hypothetical protein